MNSKLYCSLLCLIGFLGSGWVVLQPDRTVAHADGYSPTTETISTVSYSKLLRFNIHTFQIAATDSGAVRDLTVRAYRGESLLTNFRSRIDGAVMGAEVADLDQNRFPELYVYTVSDGSGSFGRVYAWQFMPERKADVQLSNWRLSPADGYMGHDSLWVERDVLCRKYPIYRPGDANADPSGGVKMMRYRLRPAGQNFVLMAER